MSSDTSLKRASRTLLCYRDTDEAEAVCGECGEPVCGPVMKGTPWELLHSVFTAYGHGREFHDATFSHYESGLRRVVLLVGLFGVSLLFSVIFPRAIPTVVSAVFPTPIELKPAIVQSSAILGVALLLTLRYQRGDHKTRFRIRVRRTTDRVLCDGCFEDSLVQLALAYVVTAVIVVLVAVGLQDVLVQGSALPLRIVALGVGLGVLRDDIVASLMEVLETGDTEGENESTSESGIESDTDA